MTSQCIDFVRETLNSYPHIRGRVLEVGSYDVNGTPRNLFSNRKRFPKYIGVDMRTGPSVDVVCNTHELVNKFDTQSFDVIVDMERLEHDSNPFESYHQLYRVAAPGAFVIITTRSWNGFRPHDFPSDYWRFLDNGIISLLTCAKFKAIHTEYGENNQAVYALGFKPLQP